MDFNIEHLIDSYGIPLVLLIILGLFIDKRVWPWIKELISSQMQMSQNLIIKEREHTGQALDRMSTSIEKLTIALESQQNQITSSIEYMTKEFICVIKSEREDHARNSREE